MRRLPNFRAMVRRVRTVALGAACLLLLAVSLAAQDAKPGGSVPDAPSISKPPKPRYVPITPEQRLQWFMHSTVGIESLLIAGPISAGWGTATERPPEYGPHWEGFGQRYGMRLTGVSTGNAMEASLGALWGEDPRYYRAAGEPFKRRVLHVLDLTFRAYQTDGQLHFAYARLAGNVGNNFLSNTWRVPSESDWQSASLRVLAGIGAKAVANAADEFLPDVVRIKWRRHASHP